MSKEQIRVAADIPRDSSLYRAIRKEQELTGRNVTDIVRDALVNRYGIKIGDNGKDNGNE